MDLDEETRELLGIRPAWPDVERLISYRIARRKAKELLRKRYKADWYRKNVRDRNPILSRPCQRCGKEFTPKRRRTARKCKDCK